MPIDVILVLGMSSYLENQPFEDGRSVKTWVTSVIEDCVCYGTSQRCLFWLIREGRHTARVGAVQTLLAHSIRSQFLDSTYRQTRLSADMMDMVCLLGVSVLWNEANEMSGGGGIFLEDF